ncbi:MAG: DnaJ domain-containing protein [Magnetococcales bacterium]|nr:DnaJ domain-containing protein [Magnetococcales bacterium]
MNPIPYLPPDPQLKERLLDRLATILSSHPNGIKEYALYRILKQEHLHPFANRDLGDPLALFQVHFLLFHLLHLLRQRLFANKTGDLDIHCLKIQIKPWRTPPLKETVTLFDPLHDYYLNLENLEQTTRSEVQSMIDGFWQQLQGTEQREAACKRLDLPMNADRNTIRARFRQLAKIHHPDAGGDPEQFRAIVAAVETLENLPA